MIRFLTFLLNKPYESCKGCETLKQQLDIVNKEKADMLETLLNLARPQIQHVDPVVMAPLNKTAIPWHKRKQMLEAEDAHAAKLREQNNKLVTVSPDKVNKLEEELLGPEVADAVRSGNAQV